MVGSKNLSDVELLSIILKTGCKNNNVKEVSLKLLNDVGGISKLQDIGINSLMKIDGIGKVKAITIKAALELGRRVYNGEDIEKKKINNADDIYLYFKSIYKGEKQERFYCVYLDTKGNLIDKKCLFVGTINSSLVHPREIFKEAYLLSANSIICVHNHPTGDAIPSKEDIILTKKINEIAIIHGIKFLDHVIIGNNNYYSFSLDKKM